MGNNPVGDPTMRFGASGNPVQMDPASPGQLYHPPAGAFWAPNARALTGMSFLRNPVPATPDPNFRGYTVPGATGVQPSTGPTAAYPGQPGYVPPQFQPGAPHPSAPGSPPLIDPAAPAGSNFGQPGWWPTRVPDEGALGPNQSNPLGQQSPLQYTAGKGR